MNIGVNDGHTITGIGSGAIGIINESEHTRVVGTELRRLIEEKGSNAINCTVDYANTVRESLALVIEQANRQDLDWFIAIHFNAGGGQGVEVYTYEGRQYQDALNVCANISQLGFNNRGVKEGTGLYVIRNTKAKSMLIEVCFVDTEDANRYLELGATTIAQSIVNALFGAIEIDEVVEPNIIPESSEVDPDILELQKALNIQGFRDKNGNKLAEDGVPGDLTLSACPTLYKGAKGDITNSMQKLLIRKEYTCGSAGADSYFWSETEKAVISFQETNGLEADGIPGKVTWRALLGL